MSKKQIITVGIDEIQVESKWTGAALRIREYRVATARTHVALRLPVPPGVDVRYQR